jgi:hypothetical protein
VAIALSPRNEQYVFNLGQIQETAKKWDTARLFSNGCSQAPIANRGCRQSPVGRTSHRQIRNLAQRSKACAAISLDELEQDLKAGTSSGSVRPDKRQRNL